MGGQTEGLPLQQSQQGGDPPRSGEGGGNTGRHEARGRGMTGQPRETQEEEQEGKEDKQRRKQDVAIEHEWQGLDRMDAQGEERRGSAEEIVETQEETRMERENKEEREQGTTMGREETGLQNAEPQGEGAQRRSILSTQEGERQELEKQEGRGKEKETMEVGQPSQVPMALCAVKTANGEEWVVVIEALAATAVGARAWRLERGGERGGGRGVLQGGGQGKGDGDRDGARDLEALVRHGGQVRAGGGIVRRQGVDDERQGENAEEGVGTGEEGVGKPGNGARESRIEKRQGHGKARQVEKTGDIAGRKEVREAATQTGVRASAYSWGLRGGELTDTDDERSEVEERRERSAGKTQLKAILMNPGPRPVRSEEGSVEGGMEGRQGGREEGAQGPSAQELRQGEEEREEAAQGTPLRQMQELRCPHRLQTNESDLPTGRVRLSSPEPQHRVEGEDREEQPTDRTTAKNRDGREEMRTNIRTRMSLLDRAFNDLRREDRLRVVPLIFKRDLGGLDILVTGQEAAEFEVRFAMATFEEHPSQQRVVAVAKQWVGNNYAVTSAIRFLERAEDGEMMGLNCFMLRAEFIVDARRLSLVAQFLWQDFAQVLDCAMLTNGRATADIMVVHILRGIDQRLPDDKKFTQGEFWERGLDWPAARMIPVSLSDHKLPLTELAMPATVETAPPPASVPHWVFQDPLHVRLAKQHWDCWEKNRQQEVEVSQHFQQGMQEIGRIMRLRARATRQAHLRTGEEYVRRMEELGPPEGGGGGRMVGTVDDSENTVGGVAADGSKELGDGK
ncbi:hypothetical protein CBR_g48876 [Chara braunii]|uniref:Uncharacterized protein n=1 Tax=Chara braunii TaxID=69332 RepID=A0A388M3J9_CHABU|nr:hypothetical protein CBR_g48876 [Chara braunii]|eukprot:GBG89168.1 hypothetical protein CBR_g48876 [Chara braunii]